MTSSPARPCTVNAIPRTPQENTLSSPLVPRCKTPPLFDPSRFLPQGPKNRVPKTISSPYPLLSRTIEVLSNTSSPSTASAFFAVESSKNAPCVETPKTLITSQLPREPSNEASLFISKGDASTRRHKTVRFSHELFLPATPPLYPKHPLFPFFFSDDSAQDDENSPQSSETDSSQSTSPDYEPAGRMPSFIGTEMRSKTDP